MKPKITDFDFGGIKLDQLIKIGELAVGDVRLTNIQVDTKEEMEALMRLVPAQAAKRPSLPLSKLAAMFLDGQEHNVEAKTLAEYKNSLKYVVEILLDKPANDVTLDDAEMFQKTLSLLPANIGKRREFTGKSVEAILTLNKKHKNPTLQPRTVQKHLDRCKSFFTWCFHNKRVDSNVFENRRLLKSSVQKRGTKERFYDEDLKRIFDPAIYPMDSPSKFFIPLLALYTGARVNELAQIHLSDICKERGITYIWFNENDAARTHKRLKNESAERFCPIHPDLVKTGFLEYVQDCKALGFERLFPHLPYSEMNGYGDSASDQFNRYLRAKVGIKERSKSLHSFRHTFNDEMKQNGVNEEYRCEIAGHSGGSINSTVYTNKLRLELKLKTISVLKFGFAPRYDRDLVVRFLVKWRARNR